MKKVSQDMFRSTLLVHGPGDSFSSMRFLVSPRALDDRLVSLRAAVAVCMGSRLDKCTYYRYFRFFGDGRVAYGLTHETPKEFVRLLQVRVGRGAVGYAPGQVGWCGVLSGRDDRVESVGSSEVLRSDPCLCSRRIVPGDRVTFPEAIRGTRGRWLSDGFP